MFAADVGFSLMAVSSVLVFGFLIAFNARSMHHLDVRRRRAEEAVSRLAAIVDSSDDAIVGKTLEGIITSWNGGAEKLYGYQAEEVKGKPVSLLVPDGLADELPQILGKIGREEEISDYETVRRRKDSRLVDVSLAVSPIKDGRGRIVGASTIARDISERKRAEETLAWQA